ncbi:MAG TPA: radical SAM protein, partial [Spirochaetia bacterium]|nr:radical SAM protein [Spirochaetia bacterium]
MQRAPTPPAARYHTYARYLRERYETTVYRIAVDAGFSCPHRGPDRRGPGCSFCGDEGARAPYLTAAAGRVSSSSPSGAPVPLEEQIRHAAAFLRRRYRATRFLLYFQAFSGTNAPPAVLRSTYDRGLACLPFQELIVSTRPDCVDREKVALLASYRTTERDVWVELGAQSLQEHTLVRINRGHTVKDFYAAYSILKEYGLKTAVHLIFGLPGESRTD